MFFQTAPTRNFHNFPAQIVAVFVMPKFAAGEGNSDQKTNHEKTNFMNFSTCHFRLSHVALTLNADVENLLAKDPELETAMSNNVGTKRKRDHYDVFGAKTSWCKGLKSACEITDIVVVILIVVLYT